MKAKLLGHRIDRLTSEKLAAWTNPRERFLLIKVNRCV
jgi:hypothetical protein